MSEERDQSTAGEINERIQASRAQLIRKLYQLLEHDQIPVEFKDALRPYLEGAQSLPTGEVSK